MNQDDHERFLESFDQYQKARRQVESIIREHISSRPPPNFAKTRNLCKLCGMEQKAQRREVGGTTVRGRIEPSSFRSSNL